MNALFTFPVVHSTHSKWKFHHVPGFLWLALAGLLASQHVNAQGVEITPERKWGIPSYNVPYEYDSFVELFNAKASEYELYYETTFGHDWYVKEDPREPKPFPESCGGFCAYYTYYEERPNTTQNPAGNIVHERTDPNAISNYFAQTRPANSTLICPTGYFYTIVNNVPVCRCSGAPNCTTPNVDKMAGKPCPNVGNPCNPFTGNKFQEERDYASAVPGGVHFVRYYNSLGSERNIGLGPRWSHNYYRRIRIALIVQPQVSDPIIYKLENGVWVPPRSQYQYTWISASAAVIRPDGQVLQFRGGGTINYFNQYDKIYNTTWVPDPDVTGKLESLFDANDLTGFRYTNQNDEIEIYNTQGQLESVTTRSGVVQTLSYDANNRLASVTDSFGRTLAFSYDTSGKIETVTDPAEGEYLYAYDTQGRLSTVSGPDSQTRTYLYENTTHTKALTGIIDETSTRFATWNYDSQGRVTLSEHAGGVNQVTLVYNGSNTVVTDALNTARTYSFATKYGVQRNTAINTPCDACPGVKGKTTVYDANGFPSSVTDHNNVQTQYTYSSRGLETQRIEAYGTANARTITTTWHSTFRLPTQITEPGRTVSFTYDGNGNMLTRTETDTATSAVRTTTWTYNSFGQVLTADGPRGDVTDVTEYEYDTAGNLILVTDALGHETEFTSYDDHGNPLTVVDANGVTTTLTYDTRQRLLTRTIAHGTSAAATTTFEYWPTGKLKKIIQPDGSFLLYTYDDAQRLTQVGDNLGNYIEYTLDDAGNRTAAEVYDPTDVLVRTQSSVFSNLSRLIETLGAASQSTEYVYDSNGNQTSVTDPNNYATTNTFDSLNRLIKTVDPQNGATYPTEYAYDARDNLTSVEDPRGLVTQYQYNGFDEVTQLTSPDTGVTTWTYDPAGNRISQTDAKSVTINNSYDALNRLTSADAPGTSDDIGYSYDTCTNGVGRLCGITRGNVTVSYAYDVYGNIANVEQEIGTLSLDMDYVYNDDLHLESITYPSGAEIDYAYDSAGRLSSITLDEGLTSTTLIDTITYQPFGSVKGYVQDNGITVSLDYDFDGRIEAITAGTIFDRDYAYDLAGNIEELDDAILNALDRSYSYDAINRLSLEENLAGTTTLFDYGYDRIGNRTLYDDTITSQTLSYSGTSNRLTAIDSQSVTTDNNGNITSIHGMTLAYDAHNRLSSATVSSIVTNYAYNGLGERVTKTTGSNPRHYFYGLEQQVLAEYDNSGDVEREYVYLYGQPIVMLDHSGLGTDIYWIHNDHLGRPLALTDEAGDVVWRITSTDAFGNAAVIDEDPDNNSVDLVFNLRFPGQYFDQETGLSYNYHRYYDTQSGRYITSDPVGLDGGLNTYAYGENNPIKFIDPEGLTATVLPFPGQLVIPRPLPMSPVDPVVLPFSPDTVLPSPNSNFPDPNSPKCRSLKEKRDNIRKDIEKRKQDVENNPQNLPERIGTHERARDTVRGHRALIRKLERQLKELDDEYFEKCGC